MDKIFGLGIGLHDVDVQADDSPDAKLVWGYLKGTRQRRPS